MRARTHAFVDGPQNLPAIVFETAPRLCVDRLNAEIGRMVDMHGAVSAARGAAIGHQALRPWRHAGRHDHLALVGLHDHVGRQFPGADGEPAAATTVAWPPPRALRPLGP